jgi:hypothetical protein
VRRTSAALPRAALSVASLTVSATRAAHPDAAHTKTMFNTFYESTCSGAKGSLKAASCCAIALGLPAAAHAQGMLAITGLIDGGLAFVDDTGGS